jgi:hypothetical protein
MTPKLASTGRIVTTSPLGDLCDRCSVRCMPVFRPLEPADLVFVKRLLAARRHFSPEADILRAGEIGGGPYTLVATAGAPTSLLHDPHDLSHDAHDVPLAAFSCRDGCSAEPRGLPRARPGRNRWPEARRHGAEHQGCG